MSLRLAFAAALLVAAPVLAAPPPSNIYVFGDSLVDTGNINAGIVLSGLPIPPDFYNPVAAGSYPGQFSNGPNYADLLYRRAYGTPLVASLTGGTNYSFGGSRAVDNTGYSPGADTPADIPDLNAQLDMYSMNVGGVADPNALYIINTGGNDISAILTNRIDGQDPVAYASLAAQTIADAVTALEAAGARHFLVTGIPNLSTTGMAFDTTLQTALDGVALAPGATLLRFNYNSFFTQVLTNPGSLGLEPLTLATNCIGNRPVVGGVIDCTGYFSFDGTHPTAQVQAAIFRQIDALTGFVPEPATWAMLVTGFGLVGATMRRRAKPVIA